jgi:transient receptor potential cation channel subfamily A member 1
MHVKSFNTNLIPAASLEMVLDSNEDYVTSEMEKQKRKLKDMSKLMESQHQLLRLIVQVK